MDTKLPSLPDHTKGGSAMQHPTIVSENANERFNEMVQAAEAYRQNKRVSSSNQSFWHLLARKFQLGFRKKHVETPSFLEGTS
jgi:hypothetical protein